MKVGLPDGRDFRDCPGILRAVPCPVILLCCPGMKKILVRDHQLKINSNHQLKLYENDIDMHVKVSLDLFLWSWSSAVADFPKS